MKLRLLILAFSYAPNEDGVANAAGLVANGMAARGHEVLVGTLWHPERRPSLPGDNPLVFQFKISGSASYRDRVRGEIREMGQFISSFSGDAILCHCLDSAPSVLALREFGKLRSAKILVSHGFAAHKLAWFRKFPWGLPTWLGWQPFVWRLPATLRKFDRLVFLSRRRDVGRFFDHRVAHLIWHPGIRVIPNGVNWKTSPSRLPEFRSIYRIQDGFVFLSVAYYCEGKNQLLAVQAYRRARIQNSALVFIGTEENEYSRTMRSVDAKLAGQFPEGRVLILEKLDRSATEAAFHAMDAFVLASKGETQPIVLLEAMAAGKPFVSTDQGCISELAGGIVVRSETEMTRQLQRLAGDREFSAKLGREGHHDYLANYRKEIVLDAYEKLLVELRKR